jgi:hypothetical protein
MQGKDFIYFLFDENNNSYYAYGDTVLSSASLKPLEFTPNGWTKIQLQNQRNPTYFAIDRSFSVPLEYLKDGAQILKHVYYNFGIEAKVYMAICEQRLFFDATHYGYYYALLYRGEIDLANFKHDGTKVTVNIMEGGMVKLIKAYENTKYEIPINVPEAIDIHVDGVELKKGGSYSVVDGQLSGAGLVTHSVPILFLNEEGVEVGVLFDSQSFGDIDPRIIKNETGGSITFPLTGSIKFKIEYAADKYQLLIRKKKADNSLVTLFDSGQISVSLNTVYEIPFSLSITLDNNEQLFFNGKDLANVSPANLSNLKMTYYETDISIKFDFLFRSTNIKALRPLYVFQRLISKMSDGVYVPQSNYLQTIQDVVMTCGDAIRGIESAVIKTSLRDFFTSYNSDFGIGLGMIGNTLRLEEKAFWVDYSDPIDLGEVSKMKVSPATDLLINNIKNGSPNQDYDDVNGKQEFNTTQERSAPITRIAKELNLISVYRKDCYGFEFTRINLDGKTTTDSDSDNDVFMIHIEDAPWADGIFRLDRNLNAGATGLLTPTTVFNLYLTGARAIRRNGNYIRSLFYKLDHKYLKFQTTDKNNAVVCQGITENADIEIASLDAPLFSCNYLEFETKVPYNLFEILNANPLKAFKGTWAGFSFVGIPNKISMQPGDNASQTFQLLPSPTTDLTQLITIDG